MGLAECGAARYDEINPANDGSEVNGMRWEKSHEMGLAECGAARYYGINPANDGTEVIGW